MDLDKKPRSAAAEKFMEGVLKNAASPEVQRIFEKDIEANYGPIKIPYKRINFPGHRPDKLYGYEWDTNGNVLLMQKLEAVIKTVIDKYGKCEFICGGAIGIDQMAAEICIKLKATHDIRVKLALPFAEQYILWKQRDIDRWKRHMFEADSVVFTDTLSMYKTKNVPMGKYHAAKMHRRNEFMVDESSLTIAVWDGTPGGTDNCVRYAVTHDVHVIVLHPRRLKVMAILKSFEEYIQYKDKVGGNF
jgi:uncharacterized phage-like protein YoqJ